MVSRDTSLYFILGCFFIMSLSHRRKSQVDRIYTTSPLPPAGNNNKKKSCKHKLHFLIRPKHCLTVWDTTHITLKHDINYLNYL